MSLLEEEVSESLGFKIEPENSNDGLPVFETGIDLEAFANHDLHLLAVANNTGYIAISNGKQLKVDKLSKLESLSSPSELYDVETPENAQITQLFFDQSGTTLYILDEYAYTFKVGESNSYKDAPKLDSPSLKSILPSPGGRLALLTVDNLLLIHNNLSTVEVDSKVTHFSWSKSSETLYYTTNDSISIKTYTIDGKTSSVELENQLDDVSSDEYYPVHVSELGSGPKLFVVYETRDSELDDHTVRSFVIEKIDNDVTAYGAEIAEPFGGTARTPTYYIQSLHNWIPDQTLSFVTSSLVSDWYVISLSGNSIKVVTPAEDTSRAVFPLDEETSDDLTSVGAALDLTSQVTVKQPCPGIDEVKGLPKLFTLLNNGSLISWWIIDKDTFQSGTADLSRSLKAITTPINDIQEPQAKLQETPQIKEEVPVPETKTEAVPSMGSFGKSSGGSIFGKGLQENPFGSKESPFASLQKPAEKPSESSTFGKSDNPFGSSNPLAFKSQTNASASSSGFGQTSFGQTSFGQSGFGKSGFGSSNKSISSSTTTSSFGQYAAKPVAFGASTTSKESPFGGLSSQKEESPFSKLSSKESPFGSSTSSKESPFGGLSSKESPFGSSTAKEESPFGKLASKESSFGNADQKKESIFGTTKTDSPFSKLEQQTETKTESSFGKLGSQESPFGTSSKKEESPFAKFGSKESTFGQSELKKEPIFGNTTKTQSPFGKPDQKESIFGNTTKTESPFGKPDSDKETIIGNTTKAESPFSSLAKPSSVFGQKESPSTIDSNEKSSETSTEKPTSLFGNISKESLGSSQKPLFGEFSQTKLSGDDSPQKSSPLDDLGRKDTFSFGKLSLNKEEKAPSKAEPPSESKPDNEVKPQDLEPKSEFKPEISKDIEEPKPFSLFEPKTGSRDSAIPKPNKGESSFGSFKFGSNIASEKAPEVPKAKEESKPDYNEKKVIISESGNSKSELDESEDEENEEEGEEDDYEDSGEYLETHSIDEEQYQLDILTSKGVFKSKDFVRYDGLAKPVAAQDKISEKILQIINDTEGKLQVMEQNFSILQDQVQYHSEIDELSSTETLEYGQFWPLSNTKDLHQMAAEFVPQVEKKLSSVKDQEQKLVDLIEKVQNIQTDRVYIDRMFSQIALTRKKVESKTWSDIGLDLPNEIMQNSLRKKMQRIQSLENELLAKMMPLKARGNVGEDVVKKLQKAAYELYNYTKQQANVVDELSLKLRGMELENEPQVLYERPGPSKWERAKVLENTVGRKAVIG